MNSPIRNHTLVHPSLINNNPLTVALNAAHINASQLASELGLSKQIIYRQNVGTAVNLSKDVMLWVANTLAPTYGRAALTMQQLDNWYYAFQNWTRIQTGLQLLFIERDPISFTYIPISGNNIPNPDTRRVDFINWRQKYWSTPQDFANALCVPPSTVSDFEQGRRITKMPRPIAEALQLFRVRVGSQEESVDPYDAV